MKKAILFEPTLLAEVERESPAVYEFYCNSPSAQYEFVEYGFDEDHYFTQKKIMDYLDNYPKESKLNIPNVISTLQTGYLFGLYDLKHRFPGNNAEPMQGINAILAMLDLVFSYPEYTVESMFDEESFDKRRGYLYNKITYQEAQYFSAWDTIFAHHKEFDIIFREINPLREKDTRFKPDFTDYRGGFN